MSPVCLKICAIIVFTISITYRTSAGEDDTESGAQNPYPVFGGGADFPQTYYFGYDSKSQDSPRLMREETRLSDGSVRGRYGYTDPFGVYRVVKYVSGTGGYFATEEIGEHPETSTAAQLFKATAPQVEEVSEDPVSYSHHLATKFNPPLYHPEAHTMVTEAPINKPVPTEPYARNQRQDLYSNSKDNENNGYNRHQIFSLSNSEDILEKRYRERIQLQRELQNRLNLVPKQAINKRVGDLSPNTNDKNTNTNNENNRDFRPSGHFTALRNSQPLTETSNRNSFDRTDPIEDQNKNIRKLNTNREYALNRNSNQKNETIVKNTENITEITTKVDKLATDATETPIYGTTAPVPDNLRHLYYEPTQRPVISYSTSITTSEAQELSDKTSVEKDIWNKIRERFTFGARSTAEAVPATTSEVTSTTTTAIPRTTSEILSVLTTIEPKVDELVNKSNFFSSEYVGAGSEELKTIPDSGEQDEPKFMNRNYFFNLGNDNFFLADKPNAEISDLLRTESIDSNGKQLFDSFTARYPTESNDNNKKFDNYSTEKVPQIDVILSTTPMPTTNRQITNNYKNTDKSTQVLTTESITTVTENSAETDDNSAANETKSAFYHNIWENFGNNNTNDDKTDETLEAIELYKNSRILYSKSDPEKTDSTAQTPSATERLAQTTRVYSPEQNTNDFTVISDKSVENVANSTNSQFINDFWNSFNEKSILFSEPIVENKTQTQDVIQTTTSDTISTEKIENTSESTDKSKITENFAETTEKSPEFTQKLSETTEKSSESTKKSIETTESTDTDLLSQFWHNFNDNSDDFFIPVIENQPKNQSQKTLPEESTLRAQAIAPEQFSNEKSDSNNTLTRTERQDSDHIYEDKQNLTINMTQNMTKTRPDMPSVDPNHYIPPLSALFGFPHMRKRVRKVQKLRLRQTIPNEDLQSTPESETQTTTTSAGPERTYKTTERTESIATETTYSTAPEETDISTPKVSETTDTITTDGLDVMTTNVNIFSEETPHMKTTASDVVYQYVPPFPILRSFDPKTTDSDIEVKAVTKTEEPIEYSEAFDDLSEIVTTIESMKKPIGPQTTDSSQEFIVFEANNSFTDSATTGPTTTDSVVKSEQKYFFPLEPQTDGSSPEVVSKQLFPIEPNFYRSLNSYEPPLNVNY